MATARAELARWFDGGRRQANVCLALLSLVDAGERWTPNGPPPDTCAADPDAPRVLAACWALWEGSSTLTLSELLRLSPPRLEAVGELLAALARGPVAIDDWLARYGAPRPSPAIPAPSRRAAAAGRWKRTR